MNPMQKLCAFTIAAAITLLPTFTRAAEMSAANEPPRLVLNEGRKWTTDAATREGMEAIREQVAAFRKSHDLAPMPPAHYAALGQSIRRELTGILEDSRLDVRASRNFAAIVEQLVIATDTLEGFHGAARANGIGHAEVVLAQYGRFFDHGGFR